MASSPPSFVSPVRGVGTSSVGGSSSSKMTGGGGSSTTSSTGFPHIRDSADLCRVVESLTHASLHPNLSLPQHKSILDGLSSRVYRDSPAHINFSGRKSSYIVLPNVMQLCPRAYTLTIWIRPDSIQPSSDFTLFRCLTSRGEAMEFVIRRVLPGGRWDCSLVVEAADRSVTEVVGQIFLSPERWHLFTLVHKYSSAPEQCTVSILVDGCFELENTAAFPFAGAGVDCGWTFGSGFRGDIASMAMYASDIAAPFIKQLADAGPHIPSLDYGIVTPQSSFDSGHSVLGTAFSKLEEQMDARVSSPLFVFTAHHFIDPKAVSSDGDQTSMWSAYSSPGILTNGFIELSPDCPTIDLTALPTCVGDCSVVSSEKVPVVLDLWIAAGGVSLPLYLLWEYCTSIPAAPEPYLPECGGTSSGFDASLKDCILSTIRLVTALISGSPDLKDMLLQEHGFHVIATSLSRLANKSYFIDEAVVDECVNLVESLGNDAKAGDSIIAALQGLLFDFDVWGDASMTTKIYLVNKISDLTSDIGRVLHAAIGLQRILDVFKAHMLDLTASTSDVAIPSLLDDIDESPDARLAADYEVVSKSPYINRTKSTTSPDSHSSQKQSKGLRESLGDCIERLLTIEVDAARKAYVEGRQNALRAARDVGNTSAKAVPNSPIFLEPEMLLSSIEDASSNVFVERVLRIMSNLRYELPDELELVLEDTRFVDTTAVYLLCKKGFSTEVRRSVLILMLWSIKKAHHGLLDDILGLCEVMFRRGSMSGHDATSPASTAHAAAGAVMTGADVRGTALNNNSSQAGGNANVPNRRSVHRGSKVVKDTVRGKELLGSLRSQKFTLHKLWRIVCMIAKTLHVAIKDGAWLSPTDTFNLRNISELDNSVVMAQVKSQSSEWLVGSPADEVFESTTANDVLDIFLHDGPIGLIDAWVVLPFMDALLPFADVNTVEKVIASFSILIKTSEPQMLGFCLLGDSLWVRFLVNIAQNLKSRQSTAVNQSISLNITTQTGVEASADACADLVLDSFVQVLIYQMIHFGNSAWISWKSFFAQLKREVAPGSNASTDLSLSCRCAGYLLQKIAKQTAIYNDDILNCLAKIVVFVEEKRLCGNDAVIVGAGLRGLDGSGQNHDLLDLSGGEVTSTSDPSINMLSEDESHLLMMVVSFTSGIRNVSLPYPQGEPTPFEFSEAKILQPCVRVLIGCLSRCDADMIDLVCIELRSVILHSAERWSFYQPEQYKLFIIDVFGGLEAVLMKPGLSEHGVEQTRMAVLTIAHIFLVMRHVSIENVGYVAPHVFPTLEIVGIVDGIADATEVLVLLKKYIITTEAANASTDFNMSDYDMMQSIIQPNATPSQKAPPSLQDDIISFGELTDVQTLPEPPVSASASVDDSTRSGTDSIDATNSTRASSAINGSDAILSSAALNSRSPTLSPIPATEGGIDDLTTPMHARSVPEPNLLDFDAVAESGAPRTVRASVVGSEMMSPVPDNSGEHEHYYRHWLQTRQGIISERLDTERSRLDTSRAARRIDADAANKFWRRQCRKVESETFLRSHLCVWKLGVAHEGHFPGRRRVIVRPRFIDSDKMYREPRAYECGDASMRMDAASPMKDANLSISLDAESANASMLAMSPIATQELGADEMRELLEKAKRGFIVTGNDGNNNGTEEGSTAASGAEESDDENLLAPKSTKGTPVKTSGEEAAGKESWSLIDYDDTEDGGYGVVGVVPDDSALKALGGESNTKQAKQVSGFKAPESAAKAKTTESKPAASSLQQESKDFVAGVGDVGDPQYDVRQMELDAREGRLVHTGPCLPGTKRVGLNSQVIVEAAVTLITPSGNFIGIMSFTGSELFFYSTHTQPGGSNHLVDAAAVTLMSNRKIRRRKWIIERISGVYLRTYRLRESALEVFFRRGKHRSFFVDFGSSKTDLKRRNVFARALMNVAPASAMKQWPNSTYFKLIHDHGLQEKWLNGQISNFDYLMFLNTMAGRTYNDLCQYPVFPWVIAQYTEPTIDLTDPKTYRDLSKPIGALNPARLRDFVERYNSFGESEIPPFMYGSHYSTMVGVVLHFLVRLQPFSALHQEIQNGRFDVPDRLFSSIPRTWDHNYNMLSEVKELTPEWFTLPEFLVNVNNFNFGRVQDGHVVDDVELPPWAKSAEDFIRINREALESEYVSQHLHEWIDLIFGYKQRGPAAEEAHNVFYYLTYSGTVDRDKLDEVTRKCVDLQIAHFGQCPYQLFSNPHPAKRVTSVQMPRFVNTCFRPAVEVEAPSTTSTTTGTGATTSSTGAAPAAVSSASMTSGGGGLSPLDESTDTTDSISNSVSSSIISNSNGNNAGLDSTTTTIGLPAYFESGWITPTCIDEALCANAVASVVPGPPSSAVIEIKITNKKLICIRDNGVVDVYKYLMSDSVKTALGLYLKLHSGGPSRRRSSSGSVPNAVAPQQAITASASTGRIIVADGADLISFDAFDGAPSVSSTTSPADASTSATATSPTTAVAPLQVRRPPYWDWCTADGAVVVVEGINSGSAAVPRVPVAHLRLGGHIVATQANSSAEARERALKLANSTRVRDANITHFLRMDCIVLTAGRGDGLISIRQLDSSSGAQVAGGDFRGHRFAVTYLASETLPGGQSALVASVDKEGLALVWTISISTHQGFQRFIASRRPQRTFRIAPSEYNCCDISWQMGIVAVGSKSYIGLFSIERNEKIRMIDIDPNVDALQAVKLGKHLSTTDIKHFAHSGSDQAVTSDVHSVFNGSKNLVTDRLSDATSTSASATTAGAPVATIKAICLSDFGQVIVYVDIAMPSDAVVATKHVIMSYALSGSMTGVFQVDSRVTCLNCHARGNIVSIGTEDGGVYFLDVSVLQVLYQTRPHECCVRLSSSGEVLVPRSADPTGSTSNGSNSSSGNSTRGPQPTHRLHGTNTEGIGSALPASAIIKIRIGPKHDRPILAVISNATGHMFLIPFPDFIKYERAHPNSALAALVSAPIQAVRGTLAQAQNLSILAGDAAGTLAQSAKGLADDAIGEAQNFLKKMNKTKLFKGVGSFFGGGNSK